MTANGKGTALAIIITIATVFIGDLLLLPLLSGLSVTLQAVIGMALIGFVGLYAALWFIKDADPYIVGRRLIIGTVVLMLISIHYRWKNGGDLADPEGPLALLPFLAGLLFAALLANKQKSDELA